MFRLNSRSRIVPALSIATLLAGYSTASAAIIFQNAVTVSGDSDVNTQGTLVQALDFTSNQTVNTVPFTTAGAGTAAAASDVTYGNFRFQNATNTNSSAFNSGVTPFSLLSSAYRNLQIGSIYNAGGGSTMTITLNGLTAGQDYLVQIWESDPRPGSAGHAETVSGFNNVSMSYNSTGADGGVGQYVIGNFTASGTSESFTIQGNSGVVSQINAMQLRAVPEPGAWVSLLGGCGVLLGLRRRRH
jgi:hypothetical protein